MPVTTFNVVPSSSIRTTVNLANYFDGLSPRVICPWSSFVMCCVVAIKPLPLGELVGSDGTTGNLTFNLGVVNLAVLSGGDRAVSRASSVGWEFTSCTRVTYLRSLSRVHSMGQRVPVFLTNQLHRNFPLGIVIDSFPSSFSLSLLLLSPLLEWQESCVAPAKSAACSGTR